MSELQAMLSPGYVGTPAYRLPNEYPAYPYSDYDRSAGTSSLGSCCGQSQGYPVALTSKTGRLSLRHAGQEQSRLVMGASDMENKTMKLGVAAAALFIAWKVLT